MRRIVCDQRSPEWRTARLGKLTASRVAEAFAKLKSGGEAAGRKLRRRLRAARGVLGDLERIHRSAAGPSRDP